MTGERATITSSLLLLYPRAWRERYGAEIEEMLTEQQVTLRTVLDLVAGAIDARLNPQLITPPQTGNWKEEPQCCRVYGVPRQG